MKTSKSLQFGISTAALLIGLTATPAFAQTSATPPDATQVPGANGAQTPSSVAIQGQKDTNDANNDANDNAKGDVVVTGSLFRGNAETPSPVTTLTSANLEQRGINTVTEAIQRLSSNGAGTLPNSFSAQGAFASGASAPSLRGLTTDSTLVLFDGLRAAYYPLADDGSRNFVDINQIPDAIIDRIDVLKDGASSTYGADAVAGVINIVTKKQITGLHLNGSAGIASDKGDAGERRIDATLGYGDLAENHFNVYVSGEYQKNDALFNSQRGYPYNSSDFSRLCGASIGTYQQTTANGVAAGTQLIAPGTQTCRVNADVNGVNFNGAYVGQGTTFYPVVRAYNATNTTAIGARYQLLNAAQGCGVLPTINLNAAQAAANPTAALTNCVQDTRQLYGVITPDQERIGGSGRATVQINSNTQAYLALNFYQSDVFYTGSPQSIRPTSAAGGTTVNGALPAFANLALPVYICPLNGQNAVYGNGVPTTAAGCTAATPGATFNPNNPFATAGQAARISSTLDGIPNTNERRSRSYRAAAGIDGSFGGGFDYTVEGTYNRDDLRATYAGYPNLQRLLNVVYDGSYNFVNQAANSAAVRNYLAPTVVNNARSELAQGQATVRKQFFDLPGGPLGVAVGGSYRHESVSAPSANPADPTNAFNTLSNQVNRFGTSGSRNVESGYFEINAPLFNFLTLNGSGRYDHYSSGQHNFSPKIGGKFTPVRQISFVSTYSKGFRIPSFAESFGLPTTGFIPNSQPPASYIAQCTAAAGTYCTGGYSLGVTSVGNPNLKPEKATNFTAGVILNPVRNVSLRVDYYNIYKKDLITGIDYGPQVNAYYASRGSTTTLIPGVTGVTADTVGFAALPAGAAPFPLLSTISYGFINADSAKSTGIDADLETSYNITPGLKFTSSLEGTYVIELSQTIGGVKQRFEDSLGPCETTACSGTPQWRASWQNTFSFGAVTLSGTAYYTAGYSAGAADDGNTPDGQQCYNTLGVNGTTLAGTNVGGIPVKGRFATFLDGNTVVTCRVHHFIYGDVTGSVKVNDQFTLYANVLNVTGEKAPYDPSTYGGVNYNPSYANSGIIGRYVRVGARVKF